MKPRMTLTVDGKIPYAVQGRSTRDSHQLQFRGVVLVRNEQEAVELGFAILKQQYPDAKYDAVTVEPYPLWVSEEEAHDLA